MYPQTHKSSKVCFILASTSTTYTSKNTMCCASFCGIGTRERNVFERQQLGKVTESEIVNVIDFANSMPMSTPCRAWNLSVSGAMAEGTSLELMTLMITLPLIPNKVGTCNVWNLDHGKIANCRSCTFSGCEVLIEVAAHQATASQKSMVCA